jgi:hypothetical protein
MEIAMRALLLSLALGAPERDLSSLVPPDAIVYAEVREPQVLFETLRASPLTRALLETPEAKTFAASPKGKGIEHLSRALRGLGFDPPSEVLERFAGEAVAFALVPAPGEAGGPPRALFLSAGPQEHPEAGESALEALQSIALFSGARPQRLDADGEPFLSLGGKAFAAGRGRHLLASSDEETLRAALRRLLGVDAGGLDSRPEYREAVAAAASPADAFLFVDTAAIAAARADGKLFPRKKRDFGEAFLFGGVASTAEAAPWIAGSFSFREGEARLSFHTPFDPPRFAESVRATFFGPEETPARVAAPPQTALVVRLRRDLEALWAARETLGVGGEGLRSAAPLLFGGRRLEDEVLPQFGPEIDFFACRRTFEEMDRPPEVRLPGFAIAMRLREPEAFGPEMISAFQTAIGLANVGRGQEGKAGFRLASQAHGGVEIHVAHLRPPEGDEPPPLEANLTPACCVAGDRFFLATDPGTLRALLSAGTATPALPGDSLVLDAENALSILRANEEPLVANDMLEKGRDRAEAQEAVRAGFRVLETATDAAISTRSEAAGWSLTIGLRLR